MSPGLVFMSRRSSLHQIPAEVLGGFPLRHGEHSELAALWDLSLLARNHFLSPREQEKFVMSRCCCSAGTINQRHAFSVGDPASAQTYMGAGESKSFLHVSTEENYLEQ